MAPIPAAKVYCKYCDCWIPNSKVCVQNHEAGDGHKNAVRRKIAQMQKHNEDEDKMKQHLEKSISKVNDAAMSSMMQDIARNPTLAKRYGITLTDEEIAKLQSENNSTASTSHKSTKEMKNGVTALNMTQIKWREVKAPDGRIYYWNKVTNTTQWNRPDEVIETLDSLPVNVKAEKDRVNQFLFNRLVQLSESGVEGASEAVCQAFSAEPVMNSEEIVEADENEVEETALPEAVPVREPSPAPAQQPSHSSRVDSHLLGQWETVEEPKVAAKSDPVPSAHKIKVNLKNRAPPPTKEQLAMREKAEQLNNLSIMNEASLYGQNRFEIKEKVLPEGSLSSRKRHLEEMKPVEAIQEHLSAVIKKTEEKEDNSARIVFKRRTVSSAARNARTTKVD